MARTVAVARDERFAVHKTGHSHPESPARLTAIYRMLDRFFPSGLKVVTPQPATLDQLELVHTGGHVEKILKTAEQKITSLAPDTPVSSQSYLAAWLAAGAGIQGVDCLMEKNCQAFFALVRPPGHHALPERAIGFCLLNNLAIAARYAQMTYHLEKILIIDWDIHHGNGLNDVFYRENGVFYLSSHDLMLFPCSGDIEDVGDGAGRGFTLNLPLSRSFTDAEVLYIYREVLRPVISRYRPDLIIVAAGFDAHADDPLGRSGWTENAYGMLTRLICEQADAAGGIPLLFSLEGGYDPGANAKSVKAVLNALTGGEALDYSSGLLYNLQKETEQLLEAVFTAHGPYGVLS